jgi:hypothetical protein
MFPDRRVFSFDGPHVPAGQCRRTASWAAAIPITPRPVRDRGVFSFDRPRAPPVNAAAPPEDGCSSEAARGVMRHRAVFSLTGRGGHVPNSLLSLGGEGVAPPRGSASRRGVFSSVAAYGGCGVIRLGPVGYLRPRPGGDPAPRTASWDCAPHRDVRSRALRRHPRISSDSLAKSRSHSPASFAVANSFTVTVPGSPSA